MTRYKTLISFGGTLAFVFIFVYTIIVTSGSKKDDLIGRQYYPPSRDLHLSQILKRAPPQHVYQNDIDLNKIYSQAKQDIVVYDIFPKDHGFFIEMGAFDGQQWSNTLWLERKHNWTGLLIEANPDLCVKIDKLYRRVWRLCACISNKPYASFLQSAALGGVKDNINEHHIKQIKEEYTVTVPCFKLDTILNEIRVSHINYFSLDVEGAELFVLETIKNELKSEKIIVDVWTIEYRVWDGEKIVVDASLENLEGLRTFFKDIGGYVEHSQLSNDEHTADGWALDVVFVNINTWCKTNKVLPSGVQC